MTKAEQIETILVTTRKIVSNDSFRFGFKSLFCESKGFDRNLEEYILEGKYCNQKTTLNRQWSFERGRQVALYVKMILEGSYESCDSYINDLVKMLEPLWYTPNMFSKKEFKDDVVLVTEFAFAEFDIL